MSRENYRDLDMCLRCKHHLSVVELKGLKVNHWTYRGTVCDMEMQLQTLHDRIELDGKEPFEAYIQANTVSIFGTCDKFERQEIEKVEATTEI